jgi:hypothetical protein
MFYDSGRRGKLESFSHGCEASEAEVQCVVRTPVYLSFLRRNGQHCYVLFTE